MSDDNVYELHVEQRIAECKHSEVLHVCVECGETGPLAEADTFDPLGMGEWYDQW